MQTAVRLACLVVLILASRPARAAPGAIAVDRSQIYTVPFEGAAVMLELVSGSPVCLIDETNDKGVPIGVAEPSPGWAAVRLARGRVGYVHRTAIRLDGLSATAARLCGEGAPAAVTTRTAFPPSHQLQDTALSRETFMPLEPIRLLIGLGSGAAWIDSGVAAQNHIGSAGATINVTIGFSIYDVVTVSASGGAAFPRDHATFTEDVMPLLGGSPSTATSSISLASYTLAVGLRTPFLILSAEQNRAVAGALFADYGAVIVHGTRSIDNCNDCRTEALAFSNGTFLRAGLEIGKIAIKPPAGLMFNLAYQRYSPLTGLAHELRAGFSIWLM